MWGGGVDSMKMWKRSILRPGGREGISKRNLIVEIVYYSIHTDCRIPPVLSAAPPPLQSTRAQNSGESSCFVK